jgi:glycosyltransferase involved in cell wall biosynthesis
MKNKIAFQEFDVKNFHQQEFSYLGNSALHRIASKINKLQLNEDAEDEPAEILFLTSYPPRECGIATYSRDLIKALNNKFSTSFDVKVCAMESGSETFDYPDEVIHILKTSDSKNYLELANYINHNNRIKIVLIQHEFGFFQLQEKSFQQFLFELKKPVVVVFHTVLPHPDKLFKEKVQHIAIACTSIVVMTHISEQLLVNEYEVPQQKIQVIAHGTHLVPHLSKDFLKEKYELTGKKVLTTFGLLSSGKSIETTLKALPAIIKMTPDVVFLVIGKTHPEVLKSEGETYREMLETIVEELDLQDYVRFINSYLATPILLEYLQLTDIYLFTSNDPNQAVSGTFVYAMSCGCPIISTPIPHAKEVLTENTGIIIDFQNSQQLADGVILLLNDEPLRRHISTNTLQKISFTAWENSAVAHAMLFEKMDRDKISLQYNLPFINMSHLKRMTTNTGVIQFSKINQPDISTGYTLDDNARALVATCMYFKLTGRERSLHNIRKYLRFITECQQPDGNFFNYVDENLNFTEQNGTVNLDDSNGRAVWALGYARSLTDLLPLAILAEAETTLELALTRFESVHSPRAIAFAIKGLYYFLQAEKSPENLVLLKTLANRLVEMFKHETDGEWKWFEGYLTYANSILSEAMLYAWLITEKTIYKEIAMQSFDFLLSQTFNENGIEVISNKHWLQKGEEAGQFGEQPIDVAYTIMTLSAFYDVWMDEDYRLKMETAFNWFLGNNRLHQIIYNPCTGGCYDGLEENNVNLNQGAESTVSYLMARLTMEKYKDGK